MACSASSRLDPGLFPTVDPTEGSDVYVRRRRAVLRRASACWIHCRARTRNRRAGRRTSIAYLSAGPLHAPGARPRSRASRPYLPRLYVVAVRLRQSNALISSSGSSSTKSSQARRLRSQWRLPVLCAIASGHADRTAQVLLRSADPGAASILQLLPTPLDFRLPTLDTPRRRTEVMHSRERR